MSDDLHLNEIECVRLLVSSNQEVTSDFLVRRCSQENNAVLPRTGFLKSLLVISSSNYGEASL